MSTLGFTVPMGLGIIALAMFYIAFSYRKIERFGWFEILFTTGNLFVLSALYTVYLYLSDASMAFSEVVFPLFQAMLWIYFLGLLVMIFNLLRKVLLSLRGEKGYFK